MLEKLFFDEKFDQTKLLAQRSDLEEAIAAIEEPLSAVQKELKQLLDIRYRTRKATPGTEESKEAPPKQSILERLNESKHQVEDPGRERVNDQRYER